MAIRYLFPCPKCGNQSSISANSAGQEVNCTACGLTYEVPQLKVLKGFELAEPSAPTHRKLSSNRPQILFVIGLLMCVLGTVSGSGLYRYGHSMIADFSGGKRQLEEQAESLKPNEVLREWYIVERNPDLPEWREHPAIRYNTQGNILIKIAFGLLAIGGIGWLILCLGLLDRLRTSGER